MDRAQHDGQTSLNILCLNVHSWVDTDGRSRRKELIELVASLAPDFLCCNEVDSSAENFGRVARGISTRLFKTYTPHFAPALTEFGNGILTHLQPVQDPVRWSYDDEQHEIRSFLKLTISALGQNIHLVNTHLEHRWEALRLQQLEAAFKTGVIDGTQMTIVVGDFNALCPHDYTPDYLQQVQQTREEGQWEEVKFDVYEFMTKNGFIDLFHELNPSLRDNDTATCRFDTRIDFVWVSQPLFQLIDLERSQCTIMSEVDISDHSPVHTILFVK